MNKLKLNGFLLVLFTLVFSLNLLSQKGTIRGFIYNDKTGEVEILSKKRGTMTDFESKALIRSALDGYINAVFRVVKCYSSGSESGIRFESATSIQYLLDTLFALEKRPRPFWRYTEQELKQYPLKKLPWSVEQFLVDILDILTTGNVQLQQRMLGEIKVLLTKGGFGDVFDAWEGKDEWAINYMSNTEK